MSRPALALAVRLGRDSRGRLSLRRGLVKSRRLLVGAARVAA